MTPNKTTFAALTTLALSASTVLAQDKYSSGAITWDTTTNNVWATSSGGTYDQPFVSGNNAIFEGTPGTVTLGEAITATDITFTAGSSGYSIEGNTLDLTGGTITQSVGHPTNVTHTITSAITGSPAVNVATNTAYQGLTFAPTSGTVTLGVCTVPSADGSSDKAGLTLDGTTTGNTVSQVQYNGGRKYGSVIKNGSGSWAVGNVVIGTVQINGGDLIANGEIDTRYQGLQVKSGGTLHYNNEGAVKAGGFFFQGGSLDNTSGAAITTSLYNPASSWQGNLTFLGSNGANSDLNLGTGTVTLTGTRTVTVANAATTLTIDGAIGDSTNVYGLAKAGPGTLALTAANNYNGSTTVSAGTLSLGDGTNNSNLDDNSAISVDPLSNGTTFLNLNFTGIDDVNLLVLGGVNQATPGKYGRVGSIAALGADFESPLLTGDGLINNAGGLAPAGTNFWDGPNTGGNGNNASDGGSGSWSTSTVNWDKGIVAREAWTDDTGSKAVFAGATANATVTLDSDITLGEILIQNANGYRIGSTDETHTLNFGGAKSILIDQQESTFYAGISGSPEIDCTPLSGNNRFLTLEPTADVTQGLGTVIIRNNGGNPQLNLKGPGAGNSIDLIDYQRVGAAHRLFINKQGAGTWEVGGCNGGGNTARISVTGGLLVANGNWSQVENNFFDINAGGRLGGTGTLVDRNMDVANSADAGFKFDISTDAASHDKFELTGAGGVLNFLGASVLDITSSGGASPGSYVLVTAEGGITGVAPATLNLPVDWTATVSIQTNTTLGLPAQDLVLNVTSTGGGGGSPYDDWAVTYLPDDVSNPAGNNDTDNLVNLLEFGFGTDPTSNDSVPLSPDGSVNGVPLPVMSGGGGGVTFDFLFVRRKDHGSSGSVSYTPQFSSDLTTFYDSGASPTFVADSTVDAAYEVVKVPYPATLPDGKKARFARMKVDEVP